MKLNDYEALTFDDILMIPQFCTITSRQDVCTKTRFTKNIKIKIPIITANMDTVTEAPMAKKMYHLGGRGIVHRFMSIEDTIKCFQEMFPVSQSQFVASIGLGDDFDDRLAVYKEWEIAAICIDVAHGHCHRMLDAINKIKDEAPEIDVIAGNVATAGAVVDLCEAGADAIKVGIGPGSMCTTRLVTGCGVPQLTAIMECAKAAVRYDVPIIADGGITKSGDIVKAIAAGAESVMVGSLVSGTDETPGEVIERSVDFTPAGPTYEKYKKYRGMASQDAMTGWKGLYHAAPEGESKLIRYKGPVEPIINNLVAGLRSGMTYTNARSIRELQERAEFRRVSANCLIENKPHGVNR